MATLATKIKGYEKGKLIFECTVDFIPRAGERVKSHGTLFYVEGVVHDFSEAGAAISLLLVETKELTPQFDGINPRSS